MENRQVNPASINRGTFLLVALLVLGASSIDSRTAILVGVVGGLIGVTVGSVAAIRRAGSPQERFFWAWSMVVLLLLVSSFAVTFALTPGWYRFLLFIPFGVGLGLLVRYGNRRLAELIGRGQQSGADSADILA